MEIISISDIPKGTGLGSSRTFTVGTINAINEYKNRENNEYNRIYSFSDLYYNILSLY